MTATATVCTGWKTAVKSGPPLSMHQICRANATPDATRPYTKEEHVVFINLSSNRSYTLHMFFVFFSFWQASKLKLLGAFTAYRMVNSSPPEWTFHLLRSSSVNTAMARNWRSPKMQVSDRTESLAGYLFSTGT